MKFSTLTLFGDANSLSFYAAERALEWEMNCLYQVSLLLTQSRQQQNGSRK